MSNLSDLLPAGAGGKQVDFVASGTLPSGQTVGLKTNGQIEVVGLTTASETLAAQVDIPNSGSANTRVAFVGNNQFVMAFYNTNKQACVGTITGTSIVFNTATQFDSGGNVTDSVSSTATGSATIFYRNAAGTRAAKVAIVSGTGASATLAYGTEAVMSNLVGVANSASIGGGRILVTVLSSSSSPSPGTTIIATVSGNSVTFGGSNFPFTSGYQAQSATITRLADDKALIVWRKNASDDNFIAVATVSGNSVTYGADNSFLVNYTAGNYMNLAAASSTEGIVVYNDGSNNAYGAARSFTISGATLTFGTKNVFSSNSSTIYNSVSAAGTTTSGAAVYAIAYRASSPGYVKSATVSSNAITYGSALQLSSYINAADTAPASDGKVIAVYVDRSRSYPNSYLPSARMYQGAVGVTNSSSFVGITDAAIANSATGSVTVKGGIATLTGATYAVTVANPGAGNRYYINGVLQQTLNLREGFTYKFDQSASSNSGHPFRFSTTSNGTHAGGSEYTTGVTTSGTPGSAGAYTQIVVAAGAPTLYYYCTNHSLMGGQANTLTGIVANSNYYVQTDGTLTTTTSSVLAGKAMSSTSINLDYTT